MLVAITIALGSIVLGTGLGLVPASSPRVASPFRTFAIVTAVAVVLGQLLPEALETAGLGALVAFGAGFFVPRLAERLAVAMRQPVCVHDGAMCTDLGLELGYVGLVLHHVGDGVGLGLFTGPLHQAHTHYDVLFALAAHTVPIAALVALAFKTHRGTASAVWRALGIAASTLVGVAAANLLAASQLRVWEPWLTAVVGGLLLHIVAHGWPAEPSATARSRLTDFAAIAAGLAIVSFGGHSHAHEHGHTDLRAAMSDALLELGLETAPMLLLGLAVAALLQTQGARIPARWLSGGGRFGQALRGAVVGLPLPVCACGVLPVAHSLRQRGGAVALIVAFLLAGPELGVDSFALTVRFLGWPFAMLRIVSALTLAVVIGLLVAYLAPAPHVHAHAADTARPFAGASRRNGLAQVVWNFDELLYHIGAWTLLGLLVAAYLQAALTEGSLAGLSASGLDIVVVTMLAVPSYVCASSATPLAAVLLAKGISAGAVLCGLLLGPATNIATIAWLRKAYGARATVLGMAGLVATTWALAAIANHLPLDVPAATGGVMEPHSHGPLAYGSAALLLVMFARAVWRNGLRSWLGSLGEALSTEPDVHEHHHHEHDARPSSPLQSP